MTNEVWRGVAIVAGALAALTAIGLLIILQRDRKQRALARPNWERMLAEPRYFRDSCWRIFRAQGYQIAWARGFPDPIERQEREVVFLLRWHGEMIVALCGRWVIPITSEIVTRYRAALATTPARRGMIVTTSWFTDAAKDAARGLPVELHDGQQLAVWIRDFWA